MALLASNLASPPRWRGAADFRRYAEFLSCEEFLSCIWANGTNGKQSGFAPFYGEAPQTFAVTRSSCPAYGQMALVAGNLASPSLCRGPADFRRMRISCSAYGQMVLMASNQASPPLRRGAAYFHRDAEFLSCTWANGTNGKQSGFVPTFAITRSSVLHLGTWY